MAALARLGEQPSAPADPADRYHVIASNRLAAEAVAREAARRGFRSQVVTTFLQGEAREAGKLIGGCAASVLRHAVPFAAPACLVFGGETTVTVRGAGRGGRNQEVALGAGDVGMENYLRTLKEIGYDGPLTIEREIPQEPERQKAEIGGAIKLLADLRKKVLA